MSLFIVILVIYMNIEIGKNRENAVHLAVPG